jgi:outer membrane protein assembly factor BamB
MVPARLAILAVTCVVTPFLHADDWPQWFGPKRDGVWREDGILDKFPTDGLKQLWKAPLGAGYSGPAVANGFVYVTDRRGPLPDPKLPAKGISGEGKERVVCLNAKTGEQVWVHEYDCAYKRISYGFGPRTTPTVVGDRVYTLGTMGDLRCLDAATGKPLWTKNFVTDLKASVPVWGWSSNPLVDGDKIFCLVGGEKQAVVAFDRKTGDVKWSALTTGEIGYSPPIIIEAGGKRQLIVWHSESVNSLDPETGSKYWSEKYPRDVRPNRPAAPIATPRPAGDILFVASFYHGPFALKLDSKEPKASVLWRGATDDANKVKGLRCLIGTPAIKDGYIYGIDRNGELRCCDLNTGKERWESLEHQGGKPAQFGTSFIIPHKDRFFLFTDQGNLILADLSPKGYREISRAKIIEPTQANSGRDVVWCHPAFANRCVYVRNDREIVCVSLAG